MAAKAPAKKKGKWVPPWLEKKEDMKKKDEKKPAPKKKTTPKMKKKC